MCHGYGFCVFKCNEVNHIAVKYTVVKFTAVKSTAGNKNVIRPNFRVFESRESIFMLFNSV